METSKSRTVPYTQDLERTGRPIDPRAHLDQDIHIETLSFDHVRTDEIWSFESARQCRRSNWPGASTRARDMACYYFFVTGGYWRMCGWSAVQM